MKILGASSVTPAEIPAAGANADHDATQQPMAIDYALEATRQALSQAQCRPEEIELIIALSLSPSRLADDPGYSYPRLSHPLQRDLGMDNAVVFDMMDADWSIALDMAQSFCLGLGYRRALVMRAECLDDVIGAQAQSLTNGAAAIVLDCDDEATYFGHADIDHEPLMTLATLDWEAIRDTGRYARISGEFDEETGRFAIAPDKFQAPISTLIAGLPATGTSKRFFCERWIGEGLPATAPVAQAAQDEAHAAALPGTLFELPGFLASLIQNRASQRTPSETLVAFTLDPFKSRIGCFAVEV